MEKGKQYDPHIEPLPLSVGMGAIFVVQTKEPYM